MSAGPVQRLRYRLGRWLLYPEALRVWSHYTSVADEHHRAGDVLAADRCTYIAMGAKYVGGGWHG